MTLSLKSQNGPDPDIGGGGFMGAHALLSLWHLSGSFTFTYVFAQHRRSR